MRTIFSTLIIICLLNGTTLAQNVGQTTDSIINYTDINGMKQGKWSKVFNNKKIAYIAHFKNDKLVGEYKRFYENGTLNMETNYDDKESGYAKIYYDDGILGSEGMYTNRNVKDGLWKYYGADGRLVMEVHFSKGLPHGDEIKYWANGNHLEKKIWDNGKMIGVWSRYYSDGSPKFQIQYQNGKRTGKIQMFHPNGQMQLQGHYKNSLKHGHWIYYDYEGEVLRDTEFKDGIADDEKEMSDKMKQKMKEWDEMKGVIPDPDENNMFQYDKLYGPLSK